MKGVAVVLAATVALSAQPQPTAGSCKLVGRPQLLPAVPEASGVAYAGGALWTLNDSDAPVLFRLDAAGRATAVAIAGARVRDWEDLATGTCAAFAKVPTGEQCFYIADIGDNRGTRQRITIYQVPVPASGSTSTKPAVAFHATYPDHPHDAEALLLTRQGTFIITKEVPARVYRFTASLYAGETGTLALLRTLHEKVRITGAAASADGRWIALRSNGALFLYTPDDFLKGGSPVRIALPGLKEPQGEGVAFGTGGELYLVSEGGGKGGAGVLTRIDCAFIR